MSGSPDIRSAGSAKSRGTSINVKVPSANEQLRTYPRQHPVNYAAPSNQNFNNGRHGKFSAKQKQQRLAVQIIEKAWTSYRDRQMYKLLKHAVCAAEHSLSYEILRKVCPKEAEILKDKLSVGKVRFRFGGNEFPPMIFFKIYVDTSENGMGLQYMSGKRMIQPASEAAQDACDLMGHRKFYDQVIEDIIHHDTYKITDQVDVTTLKDYMQYVSLMDETPSYMGGKGNSWRKLTLDVLPRQTIFYDVVEYLYNKKLAPRLKEEIPKLLLKPNNEKTKLEHIRIVSEIRSPPPGNYIPKTAPLHEDQRTFRRSRQARQRASKLRKLYSLDHRTPSSQMDIAEHFDAAESEEDWEDEGNQLYEWTQELSFDDLTTTPRLNTAQIV